MSIHLDSPWVHDPEDNETYCKYCDETYVHTPDPTATHRADCVWLIAFRASSVSLPESNWQASGKKLLLEKKESD